MSRRSSRISTGGSSFSHPSSSTSTTITKRSQQPQAQPRTSTGPTLGPQRLIKRRGTEHELTDLLADDQDDDEQQQQEDDSMLGFEVQDAMSKNAKPSNKSSARGKGSAKSTNTASTRGKVKGKSSASNRAIPEPEPTSPDTTSSFIFTIEEPRRGSGGPTQKLNDRDLNPSPPPTVAVRGSTRGPSTTSTRGRGNSRGGKRVLAGRTSSIAFDGIPDGGDTPVQMRNKEMRRRMDNRLEDEDNGVDDDDQQDQDGDDVTAMDLDREDESLRTGTDRGRGLDRFQNNTPVTRVNTLKNRNIPSSSSSTSNSSRNIPGDSLKKPPSLTSRSEGVGEHDQSRLGKGLPKRRGARGGGGDAESSNASKQPLNRRPSTVLKQSRRTSQLRSGAIAYPHSNVPDFELYRHLADNIPDVQRMRYLASWSLMRGLEKALTPPSVANPIHAPKALKGSRDKAAKEEKASASAAAGKKRKKDDDVDPDGPGQSNDEGGIEDEEVKKLLGMEEVHWNENDRANLVRYREVGEDIMRNTMKDLIEGRISISWLKEVDHVSLKMKYKA